jgi:DNA primase
MNSATDEIKSKLDIVEFIGQYCQLKRAGKNFKANCPFHQENSPSFVVSPERQIWHCFGSCNEGGDVISFFMKWENISFPEALKELAHQTGVQLDTQSFDDTSWNKKERLYQINMMAQKYYHYVLKETYHGTLGREYLHERKVDDHIAETFQIGVAPNTWDSLLRFLQKKQITEEDMLDAGLVIRGKTGRLYDRFRNRLMFPIADPRGNVIGFAGRHLGDENDAFGGKYVNTPETTIYKKRESLYGIQLAKEHMKQEQNAILVEGEFDMISPFQRGIRNIAAIKGSAVTKEQLQILKRYTHRISLALDADVAGQEAVLRGIREAEKMDMDVNVIILEGGKDPDEIVRTDLGGFKHHLKHATSLYDYVISSAIQKHTVSNAYNKKKVTDDVIPHLLHIHNPIVQAHYVKRLSHELDVSEDSIKDLIRKQKRTIKARPRYENRQQPQQLKTHDQQMKQKYLLSMLLQSSAISEAAASVQTVIDAEDFSLPVLGKVYTAILTYIQRDQPDEIVINDFIQSLPKELHPVTDELYLTVPDLPPLTKEREVEELTKLAYRVKFESLGRRIKQLDEEESDDETKDQEKVDLIQKRKELEKKVNRL